jgi:hypothetical protein
MAILLMIISSYSIGGYSRLYYDYWWLLYYKLLLVIICYITTIGDYFIINCC